MYTDPIADFLTRIRNANKARKRIVSIPSSGVKVGMATVLHNMGFIANYKVVPDEKQGILKIALKYDQVTKQPAITALKRVSRPGLRKYTNVAEVPRVMNGLGTAILTTSKGIMSDKEAKDKNVGGEVLCYVW